jgi:16S rRNA (cytosine1402-N4)-methyltransferase
VKNGFHDPVMVEEVLDALESARDGMILDGTVGGGGHAGAMLGRWPGCKVLGVDRDPEAIERAAERLKPYSDRIRFLNMRFDHAMEDAIVKRDGLDGAFLDLGVSSWQLDQDRRGFAFRRGLPLDMRMEGQGQTAADLLNQAPEEELARVFKDYGEEPRARRVAREVVRRRTRAPFRSSDDLVAALARALDRAPRPKDSARIFQAVRIALNEELETLDRALRSIRDALNPRGVLAVLAYHSLEDRIVKNAFREWSRQCVCPPGLPVCVCRGRALGALLFRSPRRPSAKEVERNVRARSALFRAWRKAA